MRKMLFSLLVVLLWVEFCCAGVQVIGGLTREKVLNPGESTEGSIVLMNTGDSPASVRVYKTDYLFFSDGRSLYGEPGSAVRSNASWISFSPSRLSIPPSGVVSVYYTIKAPDSPGLKGTYWSMLMVEPMAEAPEEGSREGKSAHLLGIQTIVRYGIQMITEIGDTGDRAIKFIDKRLVNVEGKRTLQLDIENTGERVLAPSVWAELHDDKGGKTGRFEAGKMRIYPGCSVRYSIDLSGLSPGKYKVLVVADNGDEYVFGARYDLLVE